MLAGIQTAIVELCPPESALFFQPALFFLTATDGRYSLDLSLFFVLSYLYRGYFTK
jgi:hypothetical protein